MMDSMDSDKTGVSKKGSAKEKQGKGPSDLVTGTITFIIFIIFMTIWMTTGAG
jgi:hypothetical protein